MKVLVTGATGFVGKAVVRELLTQKIEVVVLTRNIAKAVLTLGSQCRYFQWLETTKELPPTEAFDGVDAVINLMGEGIADKRWSDEQKKKLQSSRIDATARLVEAIGLLPKKPSVLVSASAVGIYGDKGDAEVTEKSPLADDFLARLCKDWEGQALKAQNLGLRVVILRTGVVIGKNGGALTKMLPIFKLGLGGPIGSGKQYMSWIHVDDLAQMYVTSVKDPTIKGVYNGTSPYPATNAEFSKQLGKTLSRPAFAPAPSVAMRMMFGEMSQVLLEGQRVLPAHFKETKFRFRNPTLEMALKESV